MQFKRTIGGRVVSATPHSVTLGIGDSQTDHIVLRGVTSSAAALLLAASELTVEIVLRPKAGVNLNDRSSTQGDELSVPTLFITDKEVRINGNSIKLDGSAVSSEDEQEDEVAEPAPAVVFADVNTEWRIKRDEAYVENRIVDFNAMFGKDGPNDAFIAAYKLMVGDVEQPAVTATLPAPAGSSAGTTTLPATLPADTIPVAVPLKTITATPAVPDMAGPDADGFRTVLGKPDADGFQPILSVPKEDAVPVDTTEAADQITTHELKTDDTTTERGQTEAAAHVDEHAVADTDDVTTTPQQTVVVDDAEPTPVAPEATTATSTDGVAKSDASADEAAAPVVADVAPDADEPAKSTAVADVTEAPAAAVADTTVAEKTDDVTVSNATDTVASDAKTDAEPTSEQTAPEKVDAVAEPVSTEVHEPTATTTTAADVSVPSTTTGSDMVAPVLDDAPAVTPASTESTVTAADIGVETTETPLNAHH